LAPTDPQAAAEIIAARITADATIRAAWCKPSPAARAFEPAVPYELKLVFPAGQPRSERAASFAAVLQAHLAASPAVARGSLSSNDRAMSWQEDRDVFSLTTVKAASEAKR
jgi:hypothetical protein